MKIESLVIAEARSSSVLPSYGSQSVGNGSSGPSDPSVRVKSDIMSSGTGGWGLAAYMDGSGKALIIEQSTGLSICGMPSVRS